jgi:hypothetical protein
VVHIPFTKPDPHVMRIVPAHRIFTLRNSLTQWEMHKCKFVPVHAIKAYGWG